MLEFVAGVASDEVFTRPRLLIVLASSFATEEAGLSTALGAFVAGLMVADTEYRHQIAADIGPIRGLLLGLFFLTVGMAVDLEVAARHLDRMVAIAAGLLLLKAWCCRPRPSAGLRQPVGAAARRLLAQGSEFAFVLFGLAATGLLAGTGGADPG